MKLRAAAAVILAFILRTAALGRLSTAPEASDRLAASAPNVGGSMWAGTDSDGDYYEYHFQKDGSLFYRSPSGFWRNGTWKQDRDAIYMETNHRYSEYRGFISGNRMSGRAWNTAGKAWTWVAEKK